MPSFCQLTVTPTNLHSSHGYDAQSPRLAAFLSLPDWPTSGYKEEEAYVLFHGCTDTPWKATMSYHEPPWAFRDLGHRLDRSPGFRGSLSVAASLFHLCKSHSTDVCKVFKLEIQHKIAWNPHVSLGPFMHGPSRIPKASPRVALASLGFHTARFSSFFLGTKGTLNKSRKFPPFPISGKWKLPYEEGQK